MLLATGGFLGIILITSLDVSGTDVSGVVYDGAGGPWSIGGSPYVVTGDLTVPVSETLTIEAGVEVKFDGWYILNVDGNLTAIGNVGNRILITSNQASPEASDWRRILVNSTGNVQIDYCDIFYARDGLEIQSSSNNYVTNSNISHTYNQIYLYMSSYNRIENNTFFDNVYGIYFYKDADDNLIANNTFYGPGYYSLQIESTRSNTIVDNDMLNTYTGIHLWASRYAYIARNTFVNNGIRLSYGHLNTFTSHTITTDNLINGLPVYYYKNCNGMTFDGIPMGQLILASCDNVDVRNLHIRNTTWALQLAHVTNAIITNNTFEDNVLGMRLYMSLFNDITGNHIRNNGDGIGLSTLSNQNTISNNTMVDNMGDAVYAFSGSRNTIESNYMRNSSYGLYISGDANKNVIRRNILEENENGIYIHSSLDNNVLDNHISSTEIDISLLRSQSHNITNNTLDKAGIYIRGNAVEDFNTHIIADSNTVDSKPVYYYKNCSGLDIDGLDAGQLFLANCSQVDVRNMQLENAYVGMEIAYTSHTNITGNVLRNHTWALYFETSNNNRIADNHVSDSEYGIYLAFSSNNITGNNVTNNYVGIKPSYSPYNNITGNDVVENSFGIVVDESPQCRIYHNNFYNNTKQAYDDGDTNLWNDTYPSGGNFWSDYVNPDLYSGPDQDQPGSDGIGDSPYWVKAPNKDYYPLMEPYHGDTIPPIISITSPTGGEIYTTVPIMVTGTAFDIGESGLKNVEVRVKGGNWTNATGASSWSMSLSLSPGYNTIEAMAWDQNGNPSRTASVEVAYDSPGNDPPVASFTLSPTTGGFGTAFEVDASASSDMEDPSSELEVRWDWEYDGIWDTDWNKTKTAQHQYPIPAVYVIPTVYTILMEVKDTGGLVANTSLPVSIYFVFDDFPPICSITSPNQGQTLSGTASLVGVATDEESIVQSVEIRIDSDAWMPAEGNDSWIYYWDTTAVSNGEHVIHARAYDGVWYSDTVNVTVNVDNPISDGANDWLFVAVTISIVIIAVIVMLIYILFKKRRIKGEEESIEPSLEESQEPPPEEPL